MKRLIKGTVGVGALALMMLSNSVYAAPTDTTVAEVSVQSGQLSLTSPAPNVSFSSIIVDGSVHVRNVGFTNPLVIDDLRGTGPGWNVTVQASQFAEINGSAGLTLPTGTLRLQAPVSISPAGAQAPTVTGTAPWVIDMGAQQILSAAVGNGMGSYSINFPASTAMQLTVDTDSPTPLVDLAANPTIYNSTITWQVSSGP